MQTFLLFLDLEIGLKNYILDTSKNLLKKNAYKIKKDNFFIAFWNNLYY